MYHIIHVGLTLYGHNSRTEPYLWQRFGRVVELISQDKIRNATAKTSSEIFTQQWGNLYKTSSAQKGLVGLRVTALTQISSKKDNQ
jgi:hypothetical protein